MPITFACTNCNHNLRVPDNAGGKRVRCPKCQEVLRVPEGPEESKSATEEKWHVKIEDGETYGPVSKGELDHWVEEGRVTAESQVLKQGADQWQWASDLYPELEASPRTPPEPAPVEPGPVIKVDTGKASPGPAGAPAIALDTSKASPRPAVAPVVAVDSGKAGASPTTAAVSPSGAAGGFRLEGPKTGQPPFRARSYPAMDLASKIYRVLGWVVIVLAGLGGLGYVIYLIGMLMAVSDAGATALLVVLGTSLLILAVGAVYAAITVITLWFAADAIKCVLDIQNNTHRSNHYLQQLADKAN